MIRTLLRLGASPDTKSANGKIALHYAALFCSDLDAIRMLLDRCSDVDVKDLQERTPLMYAAEGLQTETIRILLERGASVNEHDITGKSALQFAEDYPNVDSRAQTVRILKGAGAR